MLVPQSLTFIRQLKKNYNKPWFDAHRKQYVAARIDFSNFIQLVIDAVQKKDPSITGLTSKDCMFRINRDIRFSKDKSPYKTNFGAIIKPGGRNSIFAGYYFHCAPGSSFAGGGLWMPEANELKKLRQEVDYNADEFERLMKDRNFKKIYGDLYQGDDVRLSTVPKGYEKDHPLIRYLRLKSFIAETSISDDELTSSSLHRKTVAAYAALQPVLHFINRALRDD